MEPGFLNTEELNMKEMRALKLWLFSENVRVETEKKNLQEMQNRFLKERMQFQEEMKLLNQRIAASQQRLKQDELFFGKKMDILKSGFAQLEQDRANFEKQKRDMEREISSARSTTRMLSDSAFFIGVRDPMTLKKRYKDLLKIYHPDNLSGDKETMQRFELYLMTDGVSDPIFECDAGLNDPSKWIGLSRDLEEKVFNGSECVNESADKMIEWIHFWSKGNYDDRSLFVVKGKARPSVRQFVVKSLRRLLPMK